MRGAAPLVRDEHPGDVPAIAEVHARAFGFEPAGPRGIRSAWDVPDDVFMVMELRPGGLEGVSGLARYRPEFSDASE